MPIYEFRCRECGEVSEVLIRGPDGQAGPCPVCGSENRERLISASYMVRMDARALGTTCCGSTERCETPPCSRGDTCRRR